MQTVKQAASEFLAKKRIAVTGVSRKPQGHGSNVIYQRLRARGYTLFVVNPMADAVEGDPCFHDLKSIPGGVEAVVIGARPQAGEATMRACADLGIEHVWMHRSVGGGSVSKEATDWGRAYGIHVIDGGCPLMFREDGRRRPQGHVLLPHPDWKGAEGGRLAPAGGIRSR